MMRPAPQRGSVPGYRSVLFLGLFVLVCTGYVACSAGQRHYGSGGSGGETADVGVGDRTGGGGNAGGRGGTSGSGGRGGTNGGSGTSNGGTTSGGRNNVGGTSGTDASTGTGATFDASDDGPTSNAN